MFANTDLSRFCMAPSMWSPCSYSLGRIQVIWYFWITFTISDISDCISRHITQIDVSVKNHSRSYWSVSNYGDYHITRYPIMRTLTVGRFVEYNYGNFSSIYLRSNLKRTVCQVFFLTNEQKKYTGRYTVFFHFQSVNGFPPWKPWERLFSLLVGNPTGSSYE